MELKIAISSLLVVLCLGETSARLLHRQSRWKTFLPDEFFDYPLPWGRPTKKALPLPQNIASDAKHASGLPYCKARNLDVILRKPLRGKRRNKRSVSWPYQCQHASILQLSGEYQFIWPIYDCCSKCRFPAFTECVAKSAGSKSPEWLCPSKGLHCIVDCVNKHRPVPQESARIEVASIAHRRKTPIAAKVQPDKTPVSLHKKPVSLGNNKCEKVDTEKGKKCVRRLCVPLKLRK